MADPLVAVLMRVRLAHKLSQADLEECMDLPPDTYRHIERGRRPLPDIRAGLVRWIREFERCVAATAAERKEVLEVLSERVVDELNELINDEQH